mmetsp:Transcript_16254/g.41518  ORF Transcript_16254/g.41518 Transcript_16254/m.41518 type:complete len:116 (+) Transcript_16254:257-604(+)
MSLQAPSACPSRCSWCWTSKKKTKMEYHLILTSKARGKRSREAVPLQKLRVRFAREVEAVRCFCTTDPPCAVSLRYSVFDEHSSSDTSETQEEVEPWDLTTSDVDSSDDFDFSMG